MKLSEILKDWPDKKDMNVPSKSDLDGLIAYFINCSFNYAIISCDREIDGQAVTLKSLGGGQGAKTGLYAIPTPDIHGVFQGYRIRRLTPVEAERLQGFPDGWTDILSDSARYRCLGNAVTVNVIEAIISKMVAES